jgi:hypothetical protein
MTMLQGTSAKTRLGKESRVRYMRNCDEWQKGERIVLIQPFPQCENAPTAQISMIQGHEVQKKDYHMTKLLTRSGWA